MQTIALTLSAQRIATYGQGMGNSKNCIFCNSKAKSREHVFGKWLQRRLADKWADQHAEHEVTARNTGGAAYVKPGELAKAGGLLGQTRKVVCIKCNTVWMKSIEDSFIPFFDSWDQTNLSANASSFSIDAIRAWAFLKLIIHEDIYFLPSDHKVGDAYEEQALKQRNDRRCAFFQTTECPNKYRVYLIRSPQGFRKASFNYVPFVSIDFQDCISSNIGNSSIRVEEYLCLYLGPLIVVCTNMKPIINWLRLETYSIELEGNDINRTTNSISMADFPRVFVDAKQFDDVANAMLRDYSLKLGVETTFRPSL